MYVYVVASAYTTKNGQIKIGLTIHPVHRLRQYNTGDAPGIGLEKRYAGLWLTTAMTRAELHAIEAEIHTHFADRRLLRENDRNSEWFRATYEEVATFLAGHPRIQHRVSDEEVALIQTKAKRAPTKEERDTAREERELIAEQEERLEEQPSLREKFLATFVPGGIFRENQTELWTLFETLTLSQLTEMYSAIIQWPTGTGKTIAILMIAVLSAEWCRRNTIIFRFLLIAPKNDIFITIMPIINKLKEFDTFGIIICEGHNAKLSSLDIPHDRPVFITACHASMTDEALFEKLPPISHCHYDEVHRIGGDEFFTLLPTWLRNWGTRFLTGTSATPLTCDPAQHRKITTLFGNPIRFLHKCEVDHAIRQGWIAQPRFSIRIASKDQDRQTIRKQFLQSIRTEIERKQVANWYAKGGKAIAYAPSREDVRELVKLAKEMFPSNWYIYAAVEDSDATADDLFVKEKADGTPRILFACERYREGSDIAGIEMTAILMGNTITANILIQIVGRALRADFPGKEGWCLIFRPSEEGVTEDDVWAKVLLEIMETLGRNDIPMGAGQIRTMVEAFIGTTELRGRTVGIEETIARIQALSERRSLDRRTYIQSTITYAELYQKVRGLRIQTRQQYAELILVNDLPEDPTAVRGFLTWYDLLRAIPEAPTRPRFENFHQSLLTQGITSLEEYNTRPDLPTWEDLIDGYLTDAPGILPSALETQLFGETRGRR